MLTSLLGKKKPLKILIQNNKEWINLFLKFCSEIKKIKGLEIKFLLGVLISTA
jgi:hypothetical protein